MPDRDLSELGLLVFFLAIAAGFIALTFTFRSSSARLFPRLTGGIIVVGVVLLLVSHWLPEPIRQVVDEPVDLVDRDEFEEYEEVPDDEITGAEEGDTPSRDTGDRADRVTNLERESFVGRIREYLTPRQFTFVAIAGYVGTSYLASILIATPLFVLVYGYWNRQPRWIVGSLAVVSIVICWLFIELANAPLDQSWLFPRGYL